MKTILLLFILLQNGIAADSPLFYYGPPTNEQTRKLLSDSPEASKRLLFTYVRAMLPRFTKDCLSTKCASGNDLELLKKIDLAANDQSQAGLLFFANSQGIFYPELKTELRHYLEGFGFPLNQNLFRTNDTDRLRVAISSVGPGPIIINLDLVKDLSLIEAYKIMLHEFGHQVGLKDDEHRRLDQFAIEVAKFLPTNTKINQIENFTLTTHSYYRPGMFSPIDQLRGGDLSQYYYPHLLLSDGRSLINLSVHLEKVLVKFLNYQQISSAWVTSERLSREGSYLFIRANLGQGNMTPQGSPAAIEGDLEIVLPINQSEGKALLDLSKNIRVNFRDLRNFKVNVSPVELLKADLPRSAEASKKLSFEAVFKLPPGKKIDRLEAELDFSSNMEPEVIYPNYWSLKSTKIQYSPQGETRVEFSGENLLYARLKNKDTLSLRRFAMQIEGELDPIYLYPKLKQVINVLNGPEATAAKLIEIVTFSTTVKFIKNDIKVHHPREYFPMNFFQPGAINSTRVELTLEKLRGEIFADINLFIEEQYANGVYRQRAYKLMDLISEKEIKDEGNTTQVKFTLNTSKFPSNIEAFRFLGIQLYTDKNEGGTLLFKDKAP